MFESNPLHIMTPLIPAPQLEKQFQVRQVLLKLDNLQSTGSFKIRGIGNLIQKAIQQQPNLTALIICDGNAGLDVAYVGQYFST